MCIRDRNGVIDTPFVTVSVDENITVYDKTTHEAYEDVVRFEDRGDIGNEYIYFQPKGTEPIYAELKGYELSLIHICPMIPYHFMRLLITWISVKLLMYMQSHKNTLIRE